MSLTFICMFYNLILYSFRTIASIPDNKNNLKKCSYQTIPSAHIQFQVRPRHHHCRGLPEHTLGLESAGHIVPNNSHPHTDTKFRILQKIPLVGTTSWTFTNSPCTAQAAVLLLYLPLTQTGRRESIVDGVEC